MTSRRAARVAKRQQAVNHQGLPPTTMRRALTLVQPAPFADRTNNIWAAPTAAQKHVNLAFFQPTRLPAFQHQNTCPDLSSTACAALQQHHRKPTNRRRRAPKAGSEDDFACSWALLALAQGDTSPPAPAQLHSVGGIPKV